jgi:glycosyltransferase involved in cell wall biosynthesis
MTKPFVSMLIPSRKRPEKLRKTIESILQTASGETDIEIIVRLDSDDARSLNAIPTLSLLHEPTTFLVGPHGQGYADAALWWNGMAAVAKGDWFFSFNDDAIMEGKNWDMELMGYDDPICMVLPQDNYNHSSFPILPRRIYDILGHITRYAGIDTWNLACIGSTFPVHNAADIRVCHERPDLMSDKEDDAWIESRPSNIATCEDWVSRANYWMNLAVEDAAALQEALK